MTPELKVYNGFGSPEKAMIMGHVFKSAPFQGGRARSGMVRNAYEMFKRYMVKPWKGVGMNISIGEQQFSLTTDHSGYFECLFIPPQGAKEVYFMIELKCDRKICTHGMIQITNPSDVLISDIDDTIVVSHSTSTFKKLYTLLLRNHERRKPFSGIQDFYEQLYHSKEDQLFIYVSSSEWNLYDFIDDFCKFHGLPNGFYLLQDLKSGLKDLWNSGGGSHSHKYKKVRLIMEIFANAGITMIGDSGQKDPWIYERIATEFPQRINKIFIRSLKPRKEAKLEQIRNRLEKIGVTMEIFR